MSLQNGMASTLAEEQARAKANSYLHLALDNTYVATAGQLNDGYWLFPVKWRGDSALSFIMVGSIAVEVNSHRVIKLTGDQLQDLREAGPVQIAQRRGELARSTDGYLLRYHARIKASLWISNRIDLKVGAEGGVLLPLENPIWRFSIYYRTVDYNLTPLGILNVDAQSGQVIPLTDPQLQSIQECVRAAKRHQALAPAA